MKALRSLLPVLVLGLGVTACGSPQPTYVRDTDAPGLDNPAMGLGLDRKDLERLLAENMENFFRSRFYNRVVGDTAAEPPTVAIMPMENDTTEHIEPQLDALLGMVETELVQSGAFTVVAAALRDQLIDELIIQQDDQIFDQGRAATVGRQLGVRYFMTGRVVDNSERTADARRVQYFMFMQVLDVETSAIVWQNRADLSKGIIPL
jgi:uncharacterized protein (TIGR02722 family)